jgi:hypothetical protein
VIKLSSRLCAIPSFATPKVIIAGFGHLRTLCWEVCSPFHERAIATWTSNPLKRGIKFQEWKNDDMEHAIDTDRIKARRTAYIRPQGRAVLRRWPIRSIRGGNAGRRATGKARRMLRARQESTGNSIRTFGVAAACSLPCGDESLIIGVRLRVATTKPIIPPLSHGRPK